ncbi:MAG: TolC family protein [Candidatus Eisenbacteria bacterium]
MKFEEIWGRIARQNPGLRAASLAVEAAEGRSLQAAARPNPEIEWEAEEFGGEGERSGWGGAETTLRIVQEIETGGKRGARAAVAAAEREAACIDHEIRRLDVWFFAVDSFGRVWAAQEKAALAEENLRLLAAIREAARQRVSAGKVPPLDETRAEVELALSEAARGSARRDLDAARRSLASLWGETDPAFERVEGDLDRLVDPSEFPASLEGGDRSPELVRIDRERAARAAALRAEKAARIPNLSVSGGIRRLEGTGERSYTAGLSLPLPLFDRNREAVRAAASEAARAESEGEAARLDLGARLARLRAEALNAYEEVEALRGAALPAAAEALEVATIGYEHGRFGYLDLLEAERSFIELRTRLVEGLLRYHISVAEIARAAGDTSVSLFSVRP